MARRYFSSTAAATTLSSGIGSGTTSITVGSVSGFPGSYPYTLILDPDTVNEEVVSVTAGAGTTLTVTRGQDGTAAVAHSAAAVVKHGVSARDFDEPNAHVNASAAVHGLAGTVVGTSDSQTLTNKTLTSPTINAATYGGTSSHTGLLNNSGSIVGGAVNPTTLQQGGVQAVTISGTQTLTNKTLTAPAVNGGVLDSATTIGGVSGAQLAAGAYGAWTSWTPRVDQGASTNIAKTVHWAKYVKDGKKVTVQGRLSITGAGTVGGPITILNLPVAAVSYSLIVGVGTLYDASTATTTPALIYLSGSDNFQFMNANGGSILATPAGPALAVDDGLTFTLTYEAA